MNSSGLHLLDVVSFALLSYLNKNFPSLKPHISLPSNESNTPTNWENGGRAAFWHRFDDQEETSEMAVEGLNPSAS